MQAKELKREDLIIQYEVTVSAQDIDRHVDDRLKEVGKTMKMAGFRPGKVPLDILKKRYGKAVMGEVLEMAVNEASAKVIQDNNLRPALQPKIEVKEFDDGKDLVYTMAIELLPDFKVMDLKSIKVEKPVAKVEKKTVDETLERIAKSNRETEAVTEDRATKKGDILLIDFHGRTAKDNKPHPGMHAHDAQLELGSGQFIPGFEDQLVGKKVGDKVEVKVTFPEAYHAAELAGQDAIFDTEIKSILQAKATEINDDFAKKLGLDSEKALREIIEKQVQTEYDGLSRQKVKRALLDALDDAHDFEIPAGMKDMEYQNILMQVKMERQSELVDGELKLSGEEEEELHAIAERRVRLGLVLSEVGRANNVQITDQEMQRAVIAEAQRYPGQEAQVFEYYRKNRQALEALRAPVFEDKVVDFILELATVTDKAVSVEDLSKEEEEESYLEKKKGKKGEDAKPKAKKKA
ncbi:MAG: trigger factor [Micavibrio aeruginosavorus]|uniref:Trigger factor n=1 Tax=Micavibrio aeruginosavorus TaxID=349221 RepID=A0A7T5UHK4_9BACT|nr:MAG: trigger factor [Micavibrio aeruginosavorus]